MKIRKKFISVFIILLLLSIPFSFSVSAENAKASISISSSNVTVGDTITITASFTASTVRGAEATLTYNPDVLEYYPGGDIDNGGAGSVKLCNYTSNATSSMKFPLKFKTIKAGSSSIKLNGEGVYSQSLESLGTPSAGITVSVKDVTNNLSSNANLKSLSVSAGSLSPSFSPSTTSYTVNVPNGTTSLTVSAVAADSGANVSFTNMKNLTVGSNKQTISVVAPDGTQKNYYLNVIRASASGSSPTETDKAGASTTDTNSPTDTTVLPSETQPAEEYPIDINGTKYKIINDLTGIESPGNCFTLTTAQINNADISVYKHNNADITLVYLMSSDNKGAFFIYNAADGSYTPFVSIISGDSLYVVVNQPSDASFDKYTKAALLIGDNTVDAWNIPADAGTSDFYVIYAVNPDGETQWYQYDNKEKTLQRYFENTNLKAVSKTPSADLKTMLVLKIAVIALSLLSVALVILVLFVWQKSKNNARHVSRW